MQWRWRWCWGSLGGSSSYGHSYLGDVSSVEGIQFLLMNAIHPGLSLCHTPQPSCVGGRIRSGVDDWHGFNLDGVVEGVDVEGGLGKPGVDVITVVIPLHIGNGGGNGLNEDGDWERHTGLKDDVEVLVGAQTYAKEVDDSGCVISQYPATKIANPANPKEDS